MFLLPVEAKPSVAGAREFTKPPLMQRMCHGATRSGTSRCAFGCRTEHECSLMEAKRALHKKFLLEKCMEAQSATQLRYIVKQIIEETM